MNDRSSPSTKAQEKLDPVRAQLADARRAQILDAATQVFSEKGFHAATIRDIARAAGIADGTIYIYFKNKSDLLLGILNRLNETERRALDLAQGLRADVDLRSWFTNYIRHRLSVLDENLRAFHAVLPDILTNVELRERYLHEVIEPSFQSAEPIIEQWMASGVLRKMNVPLTLRALPAMFLGMLILRMLGDTAVEKAWAELPELAARMIFDGLKQEQTL